MTNANAGSSSTLIHCLVESYPIARQSLDINIGNNPISARNYTILLEYWMTFMYVYKYIFVFVWMHHLCHTCIYYVFPLLRMKPTILLFVLCSLLYNVYGKTIKWMDGLINKLIYEGNQCIQTGMKQVYGGTEECITDWRIEHTTISKFDLFWAFTYLTQYSDF